MSTPRPHDKWCKSMPREFDAVMGRGPYECDCGAEGVAAPLEPTRQWLSDELDRRGIPDSAKEKMLGPNDIAVEMLEAYAAAVSKERDKLKAELDLVDEALARRPALAHIEHRYNKIFAACAGAAKSDRLEKEITALRKAVG